MTPKTNADVIFTAGMTLLALPVMTELVRRIPTDPFGWIYRWQGVPENEQRWYLRIYHAAVFALFVAGALALLNVTDKTSSPPEPQALRTFFAPCWILMATTLVVFHFTGAKPRVLIVAAVLLSIAAWWAFPSWPTTDLLGLTLIVVIVAGYRPKRLSFVATGGIALVIGLIYDAGQVYITKTMQLSTGTLVEAGLPHAVMVPGELGLNATLHSGLGLGDIGAVLVLLVPLADISRRTGHWSIYLAGLAGFALANVLAIIAGRVTGHWQPASVYLVLCIGICSGLMAWATEDGHELVRRQDATHPTA